MLQMHSRTSVSHLEISAIPCWRRMFALVGSILLAGCSTTQPKEKEASSPANIREEKKQVSNEAKVIEPQKPQKREIRILLTADEHGWMEPLLDKEDKKKRGGLLQALDTFRKLESLDRDDVILLSAGDMWTGPFEATILEGAPMVQAFNEMGYLAAAVGNHEFDFGTDILAKRQSEANFPFLAANLVETATGNPPSWVQPSIMTKAGDLSVGIVGLTNVDAPTNTDSRNIVGLQFAPYEEALRSEVPKLKAKGAELIVVLLHDGLRVSRSLLPTLRELGVHVVAAGHAHAHGMFVDDNGTPEIRDDIAVCNSGAYLRSYCRINVAMEDGVLQTVEVSVQPIEAGVDDEIANPSEKLSAIIKAAHKKSDSIGSEVVGSTKKKVSKKDDALGQFIVDTWREALPYADVAITNAGGVRQDLPQGTIRIRDVRSVLPFNNYLLVVELTFDQLRATLENPQAIPSGITFTYRMRKDGTRRIEALLNESGRAIDKDKRFKVIINDFMYRGGDHFTLRKYDPEPEETAIDWREPVLRHLRALSAKKKVLDVTANQRAKNVE
ncbi:MAG: bifunctional metallophosphatase/5'-nucleotidase [Deltaproteobacteria bacterium]|nr:bifunctional metallophosphatase/5'-nucleotidase [Deltaproteobacteria bacterium]